MTLKIKANLSSVFSWNTKQVCLRETSTAPALKAEWRPLHTLRNTNQVAGCRSQVAGRSAWIQSRLRLGRVFLQATRTVPSMNSECGLLRTPRGLHQNGTDAHGFSPMWSLVPCVCLVPAALCVRCDGICVVQEQRQQGTPLTSPNEGRQLAWATAVLPSQMPLTIF